MTTEPGSSWGHLGCNAGLRVHVSAREGPVNPGIRPDIPDEVRSRLGTKLFIRPTPKIEAFDKRGISRDDAWQRLAAAGLDRDRPWRTVHTERYWCWWRKR